MDLAAIRAAIRRRFSVASLNEITRLCQDLLTGDAPLHHPSGVFLLAAITQKIALRWEGNPLHEDVADIVESHLRPKMEAVLDVAEGGGEGLLLALDGLARAYTESVGFE